MILDGSKVSDKIAVIKALVGKSDVFLIGGALPHAFYKGGIPTETSRLEADRVDLLALELRGVAPLRIGEMGLET